MSSLNVRGNALVGRVGRNYGGRAMAIREQAPVTEALDLQAPDGDALDSDALSIEVRVDAAGHPDAEDRASRQLIDRAVAGDASAVSQLVKGMLPTVRAVVGARLRSGAPVGDMSRPIDDFVQEIFLQLFANDGQVLRRWDSGRGLPLARFVALVADRFTISELRVRRVTDQAEEIGQFADVLPAETEGPEAWLQNRQALLLMFQALTARLSPLGRRLFRLLFVDERSIEEICADTGMGADAVYAWRSRLRRKAAQLLHLVDAGATAGAGS